MKTKLFLSFFLTSIGSVGLTISPSLAATITDTFTYNRTERGPLLIDEWYEYWPYKDGYSEIKGFYYRENQELDSETYEYDLTWDPDFQIVTYVSNFNQKYKKVLTFEEFYSNFDPHRHEWVEKYYRQYETFLFETEESYYQIQSIPEPLTILGASTATVWGWLIRKVVGKQKIKD
ncbi:MAG: hypothetical protein RLZZ490_1114 [Cyanobacteriota bacterium]|jgi:hypothetical protein